MSESPLPHLSIAASFGDFFHPGEGDEVPRDLIGARIVAIGGPKTGSFCEQLKLIIDYVPEFSDESKRIVLGFCDTGMFIEHHM